MVGLGRLKGVGDSLLDLPRSESASFPCLLGLPGFPAGPGWEGSEFCPGTECMVDKTAGILARLQEPTSLDPSLSGTSQLVVQSQF